MPGYQGPQYANMISQSDPDGARKQLDWCMSVFGATSGDIHISDMAETWSWEQKQGFRSRYRLNWSSYLGWKTYMLMTGCLASDPAHERGDSEG